MTFRQIDLYKQFYPGAKNAEAVFEAFIDHMSPYLFNWDYFINQPKLDQKTKDILKDVVYLEQLIGSTDIRARFYDLIRERPRAVIALPHLVAARWDQSMGSIRVRPTESRSDEVSLDFHNPDREKIDDYYRFFVGSGLQSLIERKHIKSLVDYLFGVEVGIDTARRKGVTGKMMEGLCQRLLADFSNRHGHKLEREVIGRGIDGYNSSGLNPDRRYDFSLITTSGCLFLIECNFYNTTGSKLKATAGEYTDLSQQIRSLKNERIGFIWITDGPGWLKTRAPLKESFGKIDYILNLDLINRGILPAICS